jgi:hypothetical protein
VRDALEEKYPAAGRIVIANDRLVYRELDPALAEQGVTVALSGPPRAT